MHQKLKPYLTNIHNLDSIQAAVDRFLREYEPDRVDKRVGYVSGIISSDGPEHIAQNTERLARYAHYLRSLHDFPIFAYTDIFTDQIYGRVGAERLSSDEWLIFWRKILNLGHVTDIFMTPRWDVSLGAQDEYKTAQELGLRIHIVADQGF